VRGGCQTDDQDARDRIAKARNGPRPVNIVSVCGFLDLADPDAVFAQARAVVAGHDGTLCPQQ
jgi:hypothetical protein